jgi:hypothetical protein
MLPGAKLLENTAAIDFARNIMDLGDPGFWPLVFHVREAALEMAAIRDVPLLIATACFTAPGDMRWLEKYQRTLDVFSSEMLPVYLHCPVEELERRVDNPDRVARNKLSDVDELREFLQGGHIVPVPSPKTITIDTSTVVPSEAARLIIENFGFSDLSVGSSP